jgi:hypothetical protein
MEKAHEQFVQSATDHGRFILEGLPSRTNAAFDRIVQASRVLRSGADGGEAVFFSLLEHADASVRTWAAYYLLLIREADARRVLSEIAAGADLVAFNATITLREWDAGRLLIL